MQEQEPANFADYDYVGFDYVTGETLAVPFYTFYKQIGVAKNGEIQYAQTYVCAAAVEGMEASLADQH